MSQDRDVGSWNDASRAVIAALVGKTVIKWTVLEMAFSETTEPVWRVSELPFIQADKIEIELAGEMRVRIATWQNDDTFALSAQASREALALPSNALSTFRIASGLELPVGEISRADIEGDVNGDPTEIRIYIGTKCLLMKTGEVHPTADGFEVTESDDGILLFGDQRDLAKVTFSPASV